MKKPVTDLERKVAHLCGWAITYPWEEIASGLGISVKEAKAAFARYYTKTRWLPVPGSELSELPTKTAHALWNVGIETKEAFRARLAECGHSWMLKYRYYGPVSHKQACQWAGVNSPPQG